MTPTLFGLSGDELKLAVTILYVVAWCVIALIVARILYRLLRGLFRLFRTLGAVFGDTTTSKVISLGLASLLFPAVIPGILTGVALVVWTLIDKLPGPSICRPRLLPAPMSNA